MLKNIKKIVEPTHESTTTYGTFFKVTDMSPYIGESIDANAYDFVGSLILFSSSEKDEFSDIFISFIKGVTP